MVYGGPEYPAEYYTTTADIAAANSAVEFETEDRMRKFDACDLAVALDDEANETLIAAIRAGDAEAAGKAVLELAYSWCRECAERAHED